MNITKTLTAAVLVCTFQISSAGENLVQNGDFSTKNLKPWKVFALKGETKPEANVAEGILTMKSATVAENASKRQMMQDLTGVKSNTAYTLSFDVKASSPSKELIVLLNPSKPGDGHYGLRRKVEVTTEWATQTVKFTSKEIAADNPAKLKFLLGMIKGEISLRNIKLAESNGAGKGGGKKKEPAKTPAE
ncbi:hypothetical protein NT6N_01240 [Oceaniferula spumae]|uniref:CBM-cenC domain-containing protein n=1 Tax=Oceaniferula spumae TaxID=2979115 RepID=A0AAT9FGH8_9BACT